MASNSSTEYSFRRDWDMFLSSTPRRQSNMVPGNGGNFPLFAPRQVQTFHGYAHEDPFKFIQEFNSYVVLHGLEGRDVQIVAGFHLHLAGPALTWFNQLSATTVLTWRRLRQAFEEQYLSTDPSLNPQIIADSELFNTTMLKEGQPIEDFHSILVQKGQRLQKSDVEIMNRFIDGLPHQLTLYVRTGRPTSLNEALSQAKMGEAYKLRYTPMSPYPPAQTVPAPVPATVTAPAMVQAAETTRTSSSQRSLENRMEALEATLSSLLSLSQPSQQRKQTFTCFKCKGQGHAKSSCKWNGKGSSKPEVKCQMCEQFGHIARECLGN